MRPGEHVSCFSRFQARQQRGEQFSENIRTVIAGGPGAGGDGSFAAGARARSRGLAAGAALALGGGGGATHVESAASKLDADALRRQAVENSRKPTVGRDCPFDNHLAFGAQEAAASRARLGQLPAPAPELAREAREGAAALAKHLKARQTRVGSTPFDTPETTHPGADLAAAPQREDGARAAVPRSRASPAQEAAVGEAGAEYARIRARMARGTEDLIAGDYDPFGLDRGGVGQRQPARRGRAGAPPRPEASGLLPQANFNVHYAGADPASVTRGRAAYLNSKVMAEDCRLRNEHLSVHFQ